VVEVIDGGRVGVQVRVRVSRPRRGQARIRGWNRTRWKGREECNREASRWPDLGFRATAGALAALTHLMGVTRGYTFLLN